MTATMLLNGPPACLGGDAAFRDRLPLARPATMDQDAVANDVKSILGSGILTDGPYVRRLEAEAAEYLSVRNCVAVASCTIGLMLVLRTRGLTGTVVVPSFTFAATAHAVVWSGLTPVFADVDPETLTLSPQSVDSCVTPDTTAILATHLYGTPADAEGLSDVAEARGLTLAFDAAHAFGSRHNGRPVGGFGHAEVFSLTPTKTVVGGEGGIISTDDDTLADECRIARNYGNPGDYDCVFIGLNGRMSEMHAAIALQSLRDLDNHIARRNELAQIYLDDLRDVPGIAFPTVPDGDRTTYKDFTILIDARDFGLNAPAVAEALREDGVDTRRYYAPPVHRMEAYRAIVDRALELPVTDAAAYRALTLPLFADMSDTDAATVAAAIRRVHGSRDAIAAHRRG